MKLDSVLEDKGEFPQQKNLPLAGLLPKQVKEEGGENEPNDDKGDGENLQ